MSTIIRTEDIDQSELSYVKMMKIAVAIACIKTKPSHMTAKGYAQKLCDQYQTSQLRLKEKCEAQEREILHLKQEMVLSTCSLFENTSKHDVENGCHDFEDSEVFPTPPCSGTRNENGEKLYRDEIEKHSSFLHCTINIESATSCPTSHLDDITKSTIIHSLGLICQCIQQSDSKIPLKSMRTCIGHIHKFLDGGKAAELPAFTDKVTEIIDASVSRLVTLSDSTKETERTDYMNLALHTIHPCVLQEGLSVILDALNQFSNHLREVCSKSESLDPDRFENIFYVIKLFEDCLRKHRTILVKSHKEFLNFLSEKLDDILLHLTDKFPLYAHNVWKIHAIISHMAAM